MLREQKFEEAYDEWAARPARPRLHRDARAAALSGSARRRVTHIARKRFGQHFLADAAVDRRHRRRDRSAAGRGAGRDRPRARRADRPAASSAAARLTRDRARPRPGRAPAPTPGLERHRGRRAEGRFRARSPPRLRRPAARRRQPALQHLDADPVPPARGASTHVVDQHFMLQKEVVDRMAAAPGSKDYGRLSVMLQWRYDDRAAARRAARSLRAAAAGGFGGGAHAPLARRAGRRRGAAAASSSPSRSRSAASCCATRSGAGWPSAAATAASTCSGAPKKCRSTSTLRARATRWSPRRSAGGERSVEQTSGLTAAFACAATRLRRGQPHRRVEGAAHQRHVHAEARVGRALRRRPWAGLSLPTLVGPLPSPAPMTLVPGSGLLKRIEAPERYLCAPPRSRRHRGRRRAVARAPRGRSAGCREAAPARRRSRAARRPCARGRSCSRTARRGSCRSAPGTGTPRRCLRAPPASTAPPSGWHTGNAGRRSAAACIRSSTR